MLNQATFAQKIYFRLCRPFLESVKGELTFIFPDGSRQTFGPSAATLSASIVLHNYKLFQRVVLRGGVGLGESFVDGDWASEDLPTVMRIFLEALNSKSEAQLHRFKPLRIFERIRSRWQKNSLNGSRDNIHAHYDLGNKLFSEILDPSLTYSSALFSDAMQSLEDAQRAKLDEICRKAQLNAQDHVLEIGTGWGSLAIHAASKYGCKVTTTTISDEQFAAASQRIKELGLERRIQVVKQDYRMLKGQFDKIVSVEMIEAVGKEYLNTFFTCCERLLKPDGMMVIQVIAMLDSWYDDYCARIDWIQKYIFPGSHLPSLEALLGAMRQSSNLIVEKLENFPGHYARTLATWRSALHERSERLNALGYDQRFQRMFDYYFAVCEAEFGARLLNLYQIVFTRPNNQKLIAADERQIGGAQKHVTLAAA